VKLNFRRILTGWGRAFGLIKTSIYQAHISKVRLDKCGHCIHSKESKALEIINGKAEYKNNLICTKCWCPCLEKSLVLEEKCPVGKW